MYATLPKVTFGVIVLNGMPFVPYTLRALYPFAHQIVVVEGAAPGAAGRAAPDGHSRDGTLEELRRFARDEDPQGKVVVVTAEDEGHPDGIWPGEKDEQSPRMPSAPPATTSGRSTSTSSTCRRTCGRCSTLARRPLGHGGHLPHAHVLGGARVRRSTAGSCGAARPTTTGSSSGAPASRYAAHRPPTVVDERGRDLRSLRWLDAREMARRGHRHVPLLAAAAGAGRGEGRVLLQLGPVRRLVHGCEGHRWLNDSYLSLRRPYRVHNVYRYPSWLQRFAGPHPPEAARLFADIAAGRVAAETRPIDDVQRLLSSPWYVAGRALLKAAEPVDRRALRLRWAAGPAVRAAARRLGGRRGDG